MGMTRRSGVFCYEMAKKVIGVAMGRDPWMGPPIVIAASRSFAVGCQLSSGPTCRRYFGVEWQNIISFFRCGIAGILFFGVGWQKLHYTIMLI